MTRLIHRLSFILLHCHQMACNNGFPICLRFAMIANKRPCFISLLRRNTQTRSFPKYPLQAGSRVLDKINKVENVSTSTLNLSDTVSVGLEGLELRLIKLHEKAKILNNGEDINLNSPKQISWVLYRMNTNNITNKNDIKGTSKQVLNDMLEEQGSSITPFQRELAKLVLEHRDTKQKIVQCKTDTGINNVISQVSATSVNVNVNKESERISFFSSSPALDTQYNNILDSIFKKTTSLEINSYWYNHLKNISKPSARSIVSQLDYSCPLGYDPLAVPYVSTKSINTISSIKKTTAGKKGSLLYFVRNQKRKYSECIIITRVGDFYEAFGLDAIMLMEHCGLNAMASKARAGCPVKNIQATLDCLTSAGFRVAVIEEAVDTDSVSQSKLKNRMLAQIVSPASPTYMYGLVLGDEIAGEALINAPKARPYVGVISRSAGFTFVEVHSEERTVSVSERLTGCSVSVGSLSTGRASSVRTFIWGILIVFGKIAISTKIIFY